MRTSNAALIACLGLILGCSKDSDDGGPTGTANHAPVIQSISANPDELPHEGVTTITCVATDLDRDSLAYIWGAREGTIRGAGVDVEWQAPEEQGAYWIRVTVNDGAAIASDSVGVTVLANRAPSIQSLAANPTEVVHGGTSALTCTATDDDGDNLTYTWTARAGTIQGSGSNVQWEAPNVTGAFWIMVSAGDGFVSDADSVQLTVSPPNAPPSDPYDPRPANYANGQLTSLTLSWTCVDPDGDTIRYDFYFGTSTPSLIQRDIDVPEYRMGGLNSGVTYYWRVVAHDDHGNTATSPRWQFRTQ